MQLKSSRKSMCKRMQYIGKKNNNSSFGHNRGHSHGQNQKGMSIYIFLTHDIDLFISCFRFLKAISLLIWVTEKSLIACSLTSAYHTGFLGNRGIP